MKAIQEIHDDILTAFGPGATDAFITKDGQPYFTRDGKEILASLRFDNPVAKYILKILYQAVADQAKAVGDGTTTLTILYTNLIQELMRMDFVPSRADWRKVTSELIDRIKLQAVPMKDIDFKNMLITCTQDEELSSKIYDNLKDAIMEGAYITVNKSNMEADFTMTIHDSPVINATLQYSAGPFHSHEDRCVVLHCDGNLDIAHVETFLDLMSQVPMVGDSAETAIPYPITVILLSTGLTQATRQTAKKLNENIALLKKQNPNIFEMYNNLAIFTMNEYRVFSAEQKEDISTIITDDVGIGGLVNDLSFESLLYQAFRNPNGEEIKELVTFDHSLDNVTKIRALMTQQPYGVTYDKLHGLRLEKKLGPVAQARYDELRKQLEEEKSEVIRVGLMRRLKTMYGRFIDIEVGSTLLKDSQLKYELVVDAVVSASEAVEKGVLRANSLLVAYKTITEMYWDYVMEDDVSGEEGSPQTDGLSPVCVETLRMVLYHTIQDMIGNIWNSPISTPSMMSDWINEGVLSLFDLNRDTWSKVLPDRETMGNAELPPDAYIITEPVSIICRMLENSTLALDLADAKTIHVEKFVENYI